MATPDSQHEKSPGSPTTLCLSQHVLWGLDVTEVHVTFFFQHRLFVYLDLALGLASSA